MVDSYSSSTWQGSKILLDQKNREDGSTQRQIDEMDDLTKHMCTCIRRLPAVSIWPATLQLIVPARTLLVLIKASPSCSARVSRYAPIVFAGPATGKRIRYPFNTESHKEIVVSSDG